MFFYIFLQNWSRKITTKSKRKRRRKKWIEMKWSECRSKRKKYTRSREQTKEEILRKLQLWVCVRGRSRKKVSKWVLFIVAPSKKFLSQIFLVFVFLSVYVQTEKINKWKTKPNWILCGDWCVCLLHCVCMRKYLQWMALVNVVFFLYILARSLSLSRIRAPSCASPFTHSSISVCVYKCRTSREKIIEREKSKAKGVFQ